MIGVTATRFGFTNAQYDQLFSSLRVRGAPTEAHHGDCVGGDDEFHRLVRYLFKDRTRIVVHPPVDPKLRAFVHLRDDEAEYVAAGLTVVRDELPYVERNHAIVHEVEHLYVLPSTMTPEEAPRSGTWATYRYAKRVGRSSTLILPDGSIRLMEQT